MKKAGLMFATLAFATGLAGASQASDFVDDAEAAKTIAIAAWTVIYGEEVVKGFLPNKDLKVYDRRGNWTVNALPKDCEEGRHREDPKTGWVEIEICYLGAPTATIRKRDGAIKFAGHIR